MTDEEYLKEVARLRKEAGLPDPVYVGGMELCGITKEEFDEWCYNHCPSNVSMRRFIMSVLHEANRVYQDGIDCLKRKNPEYKPTPDNRPIIDHVVLIIFLRRPETERIQKMSTLERLRKLEEIQGGRFAACARRDLEKLNNHQNRKGQNV